MHITDSVPGHRSLTLASKEALDSRQMVSALVTMGWNRPVAEEFISQLFEQRTAA
jgi:hypothetical protein